MQHGGPTRARPSGRERKPRTRQKGCGVVLDAMIGRLASSEGGLDSP